MPFVELIDRRRKHSKIYQDNINPRRFAIDSSLATLHYESALDSGIYNTSIDCTPTRINNATADGWRITANNWHYFLGRDLANHGTEDGWIGFGGRRGAHWFKFRLLRVGYLRWSDRTWQSISSAPTYTRSKLVTTTNALTLPTLGENIPAETVVTWPDIFTTTGGGSLSLRWRIDGDRLKEEITINSAARSWITANRGPGWAFPGEPLDNVWFGFVFRLDWSDVPRRLRDGIVIDPEDDTADDGQGIELRDALDHLLAFMPVDELKVGSERATLRKRFYRDQDGNDYLLVGVRCDTLVGLPAGDLIFDPTIDTQIATTADDANWYDNIGLFFNTDCSFGRRDTTWGYRNALYRFTGLTFSGTINASYLTFRSKGTDAGTVAAVISAIDGDNPAAPTDATGAEGATRTTATVSYSPAAWDNGSDYNSDSLNTIFQELADSYTISNDAVVIFIEGVSPTADNNIRQPTDYSDSAANAPRLHLEYTATATTSLPVFHRKNYAWKGRF